MAIADFGAGAQIDLKQLLFQRMQAQQYADHLKQQDFENRRQLSGDRRADRQMEETSGLRKAAEADLARQRTFGEANALADQIPGDTFLGDKDPAVATMQQGGRGSLLSQTPEVKPMGPEFQGPMQGGVTPQQAQVGRPGGFLKTRSAKQIDTETDNTRQAEAITRQREADTERERHDKAMEGAALAKGNTSGDSRMDRSYQYHRSSLDKIAKPLEDQQQRMGRLIESVNQGTPQADALVAPELLTVMAGGAGSGLRMNEAEISRIIGGRSKWQTLQATLNQWATDPSKANSITPEQRADIRKLIAAVHDKSQQAIAAVNEAGDRLIDAHDVLGHRQVFADTRKKLQQIYEPAGGVDPAPGGGGTVAMVAPDGRALNVPADKVAELEAKGAKRR